MIGFQNKLDISLSIVVKNHSGNIGLRYFHLRFGSKYSNEKKKSLGPRKHENVFKHNKNVFFHQCVRRIQGGMAFDRCYLLSMC